jgi:hypothetical protein
MENDKELSPYCNKCGKPTNTGFRCPSCDAEIRQEYYPFLEPTSPAPKSEEGGVCEGCGGVERCYCDKPKSEALEEIIDSLDIIHETKRNGCYESDKSKIVEAILSAGYVPLEKVVISKGAFILACVNNGIKASIASKCYHALSQSKDILKVVE